MSRRERFMGEDLIDLLADLKEKKVLEVAQERLSAGDDPWIILSDTRQAMEIIGKRFENREYFIPDLIYSGEILKEISEIIKPRLNREDEIKRLGRAVIGTVSGDIHDIGKNIVTFMLDANGFKVYDLGVDVPAQRFVDKIEETNVGVVGLSGFLTLAFDSMKETIEAIKSAGLRHKVKIMIGGGVINDEIKAYTGADAYGPDAMAAVSLAKRWVGGQ
jgi:5-methyltetrahydrofolate--homocysteine methyltransferase